MSSTEVSIFGSSYKGGLPAHLQNLELDATTKALMGNPNPGKRISIKGGVYRMIVDGKQVAVNEDRSMNLVIVAANPHVSRTFYSGTYVEGEVSAPDCASADGITPDENVKNKQANKCANCPQNIAGSGSNGSRACRFSQRIAVVLENQLDGDVYQISLPAQSIFGKAENGKHPLQAYAKLLGSHNLPVTAVVTEAKFDTERATPKLTFRAVRPLTESELAVVLEQGASEEAITAISNTPSTLDGAETSAEKPAASKSEAKRVDIQKRAQTAKVDPLAEEGEEVAAPTKTTKKKPVPQVVLEESEEADEQPTKVKSILDEIESWEDDPA